MKQLSQCSGVLTNVLCVFSWFFFDTKQDVFFFGLNAFRSIDFRLVYLGIFVLLEQTQHIVWKVGKHCSTIVDGFLIL